MSMTTNSEKTWKLFQLLTAIIGASPYSGAKLRLADEIGKKNLQKKPQLCLFYIFYGINFPYIVEKS